jgi:hypothetical protein
MILVGDESQGPVDRANDGRLRPVVQGMATRPELEPQIVTAGTMLLKRLHQRVQA